MSAPLRLHWSAISDVGRVRKDNQDSGYAGPWLLAVCDGVGGAARGDIASSTAISQVRKLDDESPAGLDAEHLLSAVAGALHRAHDRIGELVDEDPSLSGTSTTATLLFFDGAQLAVGHVGDSRAYLMREGSISQLTSDHTFVQSLIDEGRITPEEALVHPHRNVILKALDGMHEAEPDLFMLTVQPGDRLLVCSDGATASLGDDRICDILGTGTPDYAAIELTRASLEAGSTDNVTCIVADVLDPAGAEARAEDLADLQPMLVGAASELRRKPARSGRPTALFRGHRSGDTGEMEPIDADLPDLPADVHAIHTDPIDPESARYAPRAPHRFAWLRRLLGLITVVGVAWVGVAAAWTWVQDQYYVGEVDGQVCIFRGVNSSLPGVSLSEPYEATNISTDRLRPLQADGVASGLAADDLDDARGIVENLAKQQVTSDEGTTSTTATTPADVGTCGS
ncbi:serine/threonine-protein phosphatase [Nocardioides sp. CBS4Y-1]|uniref:Serine/threonine-protein phosphatase n=1 Tax=Nocardioides acrostichi TaxID=2784339 RepID=A0A930UZW4_9ACTN|nr:serine/threonine-protein phosphatase [Nocardioides acrostichi]